MAPAENERAAKKSGDLGGSGETRKRTHRSAASGESTPDNLLHHAFKGATGTIFITQVPGDPNVARGAWSGHTYEAGRTLLNGEANLFFCVSELKPDAKTRTKGNWHALRVLMLDDIGTKVSPTKIPIRPTYRIETSPSNEQWGFFLTEPLTNKTKAERLHDAVKDYGATDKGGMNLVRWARLPGGINGKPRDSGPFKVRLCEFDPERRYAPEAIAVAFGVELMGQRGRPEKDLPPLAATEDPLLEVLSKAKLIKSETPSNNGFFEIRCPWVDGHTNGNDAAGYKPGGVFKCFHDHCAVRTIDDLLGWLREAGFAADVEAAVTGMPGPRGALLRALRRYIYARDMDCFIDMEQVSPLKVDALDRYEAANIGAFKMSRYLLLDPALRRALATVYLPGKPELLEINESGRPMLAANLWRSGPIAPAAASDPDLIEPWLAHLRWLFPDDAERVITLDYLTHLVQRRGERINWMLAALAVVEGTGRDTLLKPVRDILGIRNVRTVNAEDLFSSFNDWLLVELVCFAEIDTVERSSKWGVYRALKAYITTPPDTVSINRKFFPAIEQPKVANFVMFTNDPAALAFDRAARRICVVESPHDLATVKQYGAGGAFRQLHELYDDSAWLAAFHHYLLDRSISSSFDPKGRAPETAATHHMRDASRSTLEVVIEEAIVEARGVFAPDLVRPSKLKSELELKLCVGSKVSYNALNGALRAAGALELPEFKDADNNNVKNAWALRDVARYAGMSPSGLREVWQARDAGIKKPKKPKY